MQHYPTTNNTNTMNQRNQYSQLGAHEVMEIHEVLTSAINGINKMQLVGKQIQDTQLRTIVSNQLQFMVQEYNTLVQAVSNKTGQTTMNQIGTQGINQTSHLYRNQTTNYAPTYGLDNPSTMSPVSSVNQLQDQDIASIILELHKVGANKKMLATLECADPQLRRILMQGAVNCSELAYETWQFMNQRGYYQVPTLKQTTTDTFVNTYSTASNINLGAVDTAYNTNTVRQYQ